MKDADRQAKINKLGRKLGDRELAVLLVAAGLDNPRKVKDASDETLEVAVGKAGKDKVRGKIAKKPVAL